ncbi:Hypothetical protein NCS54_00988400 [Fusarium falciforme]|uniref:Hypothetical protein n=1 Tax=Fusarium falciforme TaxID=195108 RepID=UPI0022FFD603|nr:Hypothetical protein NCS54_00988400 [Fusarium falciforme]WAO92378.1 Hypothetical protein NCS54_00988400 [Fusarium falciforme]
MGDELCYLLEPSWTLGQERRLQLIGNSPLANEGRYLRERPDLAFVVYKHYKTYDDRAEAGKQTTVEGPMLDAPVPAGKTVQLLSEQMILAVDELVNTQPTFEDCFPDWDSKEPIHSPFLF